MEVSHSASLINKTAAIISIKRDKVNTFNDNAMVRKYSGKIRPIDNI